MKYLLYNINLYLGIIPFEELELPLWPLFCCNSLTSFWMEIISFLMLEISFSETSDPEGEKEGVINFVSTVDFHACRWVKSDLTEFISASKPR